MIRLRGEAVRRASRDSNQSRDAFVHWEFWVDLTASSAVNLPISNANCGWVWFGWEFDQPLHVFGGVSTATVNFHNKFRAFHKSSLLLSSAIGSALDIGRS
jgi:hypothetical protein